MNNKLTRDKAVNPPKETGARSQQKTHKNKLNHQINRKGTV